MDYMDEIEQIVITEMQRDNYEALTMAAARMLCIEMFLCYAGNGPEEGAEHVFLTASNHPVFLRVMNATSDYKFDHETSIKLFTTITDLAMETDSLDDQEKVMLNQLAELIENRTEDPHGENSSDIPPDHCGDDSEQN